MLPVVLRTNNNSPWTNEFDSKSNPSQNPFAINMRKKTNQTKWACQMLMWSHFPSAPAEIELSCLIESISTINPRIEWKKITNEGPSYVYFERKISGNAPNPQLFGGIDIKALLFDHFLFLQATWRTEL